jgi:hypothetical protein
MTTAAIATQGVYWISRSVCLSGWVLSRTRRRRVSLSYGPGSGMQSGRATISPTIQASPNLRAVRRNSPSAITLRASRKSTGRSVRRVPPTPVSPLRRACHLRFRFCQLLFQVRLLQLDRFRRLLPVGRVEPRQITRGGNAPSANMCLSYRAESAAQPEESQRVTKLIEHSLRLPLRPHRALLKHAKYVTAIAR